MLKITRTVYNDHVVFCHQLESLQMHMQNSLKQDGNGMPHFNDQVVPRHKQNVRSTRWESQKLEI